MDEKIIWQVVNSPVRYGDTEGQNCHCWAELIALYEDGTWEKIFEYRWTNPDNVKRFTGGKHLVGKTRGEAITMLEKQHNAGKLIGVFMV